MYVATHAIRELTLREDPLKVLYLGISPDGIPLEVVVVETSRGPALIHAMRMRTKYVKLMEGGRRWI
ncbi:putative toxin-antitoxin system, toxin component [Bifidobacterium stellenboschense]|uniref:Putative toxin-antitoxin system, toxin component n=2 Tax=Bifidobacterium stellenboschense TaxID=762211 RepID=A0A087DZH2_9BIFI|nr:putative toxin-antitoxin system, toxin component [Bifidobacterium stellenboschense]